MSALTDSLRSPSDVRAKHLPGQFVPITH